MWIDVKPIYMTLESQSMFVRGLCPKTAWAGAASLGFGLLDSPLLAPKLFSCITPWVKTHWRFSRKKRCTTYIRLGKHTSEKPTCWLWYHLIFPLQPSKIKTRGIWILIISVMRPFYIVCKLVFVPKKLGRLSMWLFESQLFPWR